MKKLTAILMTICMSAFVFGCDVSYEETTVENKTINVLAAASLTDVMRDLELGYEADHPGSCGEVIPICFYAGSAGEFARMKK